MGVVTETGELYSAPETKQVIAGSAEESTDLISPEEETYGENEPLINGLRLFYVCIILYLYGDLAIYAAAVPKSLALVSCTHSSSSPSSQVHPNNTNHSHSENTTTSHGERCWGNISMGNVYRIYLLIFALTLGPFAFFNVQKTKYLQMVTTLLRWLAFTMMIVLAVLRISQGKNHHQVSIADFSGVPNLFGVCIYAFMCQHSLPSFITPMKSKSRVTLIFSLDFGIILLFYALLSFSAMFAFSDLLDLYTLNFQYCTPFIHYFLALFPVFTLSTNFPIISITLRDNLKNLFHREGRPYPWIIDRIAFPIATILPPIGVAFATQNLEPPEVESRYASQVVAKETEYRK
ncbi:hypothetical protein QZH41_008387, partial [Actinostola sp. cb2023]